MFKFINGLLRPGTTDLAPDTFSVSRRGFLVGVGAMLAMPAIVKLETIREMVQPRYVWMLDFSIFSNTLTAEVVEIGSMQERASQFVAPINTAKLLEEKYERWAKPGIEIAITPQDLGLPLGSLVPQRRVWGSRVHVPDLDRAELLQKEFGARPTPAYSLSGPDNSFEIG